MSHIIHGILTFLSAASCATGIALGEISGWYLVRVPTLSATYSVGPFSACSTVDDTCAACLWSGDGAVNAMWIGVRVSSIAAGAVHFVLIFTVLSIAPGVKTMRIWMSLVGLGAWAACMALTPSLAATLGCGVSSANVAQPCVYSFVFPFWVMVAGAGCSLLCLICSFLAPTQRDTASRLPAPTEPTSERNNTQPAPFASNTGRTPIWCPTAYGDKEWVPEQQQSAYGLPVNPTAAGYLSADPKFGEPQDADWVFDATDGMYRSGQTYMFPPPRIRASSATNPSR